MDIGERIIQIFENRKQRNILILAVLTIIFISLVVYQITHTVPPPPSGAKRVVMCKSCKKLDVQRIYKIHQARCRFCKTGEVAFAWKCNKCQYEFYITDKKFNTEKMNTMQRFQQVVDARKCPNCRSTDTRTMTLQDMKKKGLY